MSNPDAAPGRSGEEAELHTHTVHSDGVLTPEQLVEAAVEAGLCALAVTDHDTLGAIPAARAAATDRDLELIAGIEFSSAWGDVDLHLLGLFVDETDPGIRRAAERYHEVRRERARNMLAALERLDVAVEMEAVERISGPGSIGRPHVAQALVEAGHVGDPDEAFARYIGVGRPGWVPKPGIDAGEVCDRVHAAGGIAVLAHPASSRVSTRVIEELAERGVDGVETRHPRHSRGQADHLERLARRLSLLTTSGSDYHGPGRGTTRLGEYPVSRQRLERLRQRSDSWRARGAKTAAADPAAHELREGPGAGIDEAEEGG